jgi:hypothetical protein
VPPCDHAANIRGQSTRDKGKGLTYPVTPRSYTLCTEARVPPFP